MAIPLFLVNNFGVFEPKPFFAIEDADWMRFFETNVLSGVRLSRHHAPRMRERGWERIIFISSESALNIPQEMIHWHDEDGAARRLARPRNRVGGERRHRERGAAHFPC